ncbi:GPW/gp25 family protein [Salinicola sp. DM10]|uniref:GPW/gp25 family protein n=1 Tax=Salinicola sp. DM10 TaxID=2815721 RepID=UPI0004E6A1C7|nr:GPW/gp25 family protein [Salinicola sp. DM10]KFF48781.1 baseplate assembly protein [Gammaproteobacteria bacterium MFB021]MCE3028570.1 GPW/gp25 family protein [Salinicola sp. DM10]
MAGMDRTSGAALAGIAHIRQSVTDILTTPIGSRVMRRDYGSLLPELIDQPLDGATALRAYSATVVALMRWEPRIRVKQITRHVSTTRPGRLTLSVHAERVDDGADLTFDIPLGQET